MKKITAKQRAEYEKLEKLVIEERKAIRKFMKQVEEYQEDVIKHLIAKDETTFRKIAGKYLTKSGTSEQKKQG